MSKKAPEVSSNQGILADHGNAIADVPGEVFDNAPAEVLMGQDYPIAYGPPGSYVNIHQRAIHLTAALTAFGFRNQRLGFDEASNDPEYKEPIWRRYGNKLGFVQAGADRNLDRYQQDAKVSFWKATGYGPLRRLGTYSVRACNAQSRKMWREFYDDFNAPNKREARGEYKKLLKRSMKASEAIVAHEAQPV